MHAQEYWNEIRVRICRRCIDGDGTGRCLVDPAIGCALQTQLPLIISTVGRVSSDKVADYTADLRAIVCGQCEHAAPDASCAVRADLACALDRYFALVIDIIEELKDRKATLPSLS
jgi:hypothetical protein